MNQKKVTFILVIVIILSFATKLFIRSDDLSSFYGFVEITDKKVIEKEIFEDEYQLNVRMNYTAETAVMNKSDQLIYGANLNSTEEYEVRVEEIWEEIEIDNWYFMKLDKKGKLENGFEILYFNPNVPYND